MSWKLHHSLETAKMTLQDNTQKIFGAVAAAEKASSRPPGSVKVVAVTKYVDSSLAKDLIQTGVQHIGENRVDKFLEKYQSLHDEAVTWHLIGTLQRRKVKDVIAYVDYFHALDSLSLAGEIQKRAPKVIKCFLQVNISGEQSKHGFSLEEVDQVLEQLAAYDKIELVGLMTMAPFEADRETLVDLFSRMKDLRDSLSARQLPRMPLTELSMGMSGDFEEAILHGATFVRIGTAFFE